jgi:serine/threonine protein kinase
MIRYNSRWVEELRGRSLSAKKLIGQTVGNYVISEELGAGGMGAVFLAEHPHLGKQVAVKVLHSHFSPTSNVADRFLIEAKAIAKIEHPNIIDVYDFGVLGDSQLYYIMERLRGRELVQVMKAQPKMSCAEVFPYLRQISSALEAAHGAGIVHRDLKPSNIFVQDGTPPRIKLLDFGIAKMFEEEGDSPTLTTTGLVMGTPTTMAPEQAAGNQKAIGPCTDIYALGVITFWMLAGRPPFVADASAVILALHITKDAPNILEFAPDVPKGVAELLAQCLAKDPAQRPKTASEIARVFADATGLDYDSVITRTGLETSGLLRPPERSIPPVPIDELSIGTSSTVMGSQHLTGPMPGPLAQHTTLGGAAGEISALGHQAPQKKGRGLTFLTLGIVAAAAAVGAYVTLGNPSVQTPPAEKSVAASSERRVSTNNGPKQILTVTTLAPNATCTVRLAHNEKQVQRAPCRFELLRGSPLTLKVESPQAKAFTKSITIESDTSFDLKVDPKKSALIESKGKGKQINSDLAYGSLDSKALIKKALAEYAQGRFEASVHALKAAHKKAESAEELAQIHLHLGFNYVVLDKMKLAAKEFARALTYDAGLKLETEEHSPSIVRLFDRAKALQAKKTPRLAKRNNRSKSSERRRGTKRQAQPNPVAASKTDPVAAAPKAAPVVRTPPKKAPAKKKGPSSLGNTLPSF